MPPFPAFRRRHGISTVGDHSVLNNAANSTGQRQSSAPPNYSAPSDDRGQLATRPPPVRRDERWKNGFRAMCENARLMRIFVSSADARTFNECGALPMTNLTFLFGYTAADLLHPRGDGEIMRCPSDWSRLLLAAATNEVCGSLFFHEGRT